MIGLILHDKLGIGDKIQFTHIPENIYYFTGKKVYDISRSWVFDHNPFVERNLENISNSIDLWNLSHSFPKDGFKSHAERFFILYNKIFETNYQNPVLRHPRLYKYENNKIKPNRVLVHTTGKSETTPLQDEVIEHIKKNYKDYEVIQIGGLNDKKTPFINKLGMPLWETVELIATSGIFIGINSGMMNIANCFPRVCKKIVLASNFDNFLPMSYDNCWFDHGVTYFNPSKYDIGATFSFLKL
jgi:hypothetical protein